MSQYTGQTTQQPSANHGANEQNQSQKSEGLWDWIFHDAAGFFTLWLVIVGGGQIVLFYVQLRLIRESLDDAKIAADAAAIAANAASRQAIAAERSLTEIERPYLFIFNVSRLESIEIEDWQVDTAAELLLSVTYTVANHGRMPAIIKSAQAILSAAADPPLPNLLPGSHPLVTSPIFAIGEIREDIAEMHAWNGNVGNDEDDTRIPVIPDGNELFLWIAITYRGPFTDQHETRACWIYNKGTGRFTGPWGGPEYSGSLASG